MLHNQRLHVLLGALTGLLFAILLAPHPDTSIEVTAPTEIVLHPATLRPQALKTKTLSYQEQCDQRIAVAAAEVETHPKEQAKYWQFYANIVRSCSPSRKPHAPAYRETQDDFNPFTARSARSFRY